MIPSRWKRSGGKYLLASIAFHAVLAIVATFLVVTSITEQRKKEFVATKQAPPPSRNSLEHTVSLAKKKSTMSAPTEAKRAVSTNTKAKISLPDMPVMPHSESTAGKTAGLGGAGVSGIIGMGGPGLSAGGGGKGMTVFGFKEKPKSALVGYLYDLKQSSDGKEKDVSDQEYQKIISSFIEGGCKEASLKKFYRSPTPLYATKIWIPMLDANEGPKAFNVADKVKPKHWMVHYSGKIIPPEAGSYHFVCFGDDVCTIRFNGRTVCDGGYDHIDRNRPKGNYILAKAREQGGDLYEKVGGHQRGSVFSVQAGQAYPIDIVIGEDPGGQMYYSVLIEKDNTNYEKDSRGSPILPVFEIAGSEMPQDGQNLPAFSKDRKFWTVKEDISPFKSALSNP